MKKIIGNQISQWTCQCSGTQGLWTGNYSSQIQISKAIKSYCSGGGYCERDFLTIDSLKSNIIEIVSDDGITTKQNYVLIDKKKLPGDCRAQT
ncbi:MAG: hypothetical protein ING84_18155 [Cytophagales bacterium]|jgi:hypothetical protein|nr:hypothetical protein [Cytophagales bacterium]